MAETEQHLRWRVQHSQATRAALNTDSSSTPGSYSKGTAKCGLMQFKPVGTSAAHPHQTNTRFNCCTCRGLHQTTCTIWRLTHHKVSHKTVQSTLSAVTTCIHSSDEAVFAATTSNMASQTTPQQSQSTWRPICCSNSTLDLVQQV